MNWSLWILGIVLSEITGILVGALAERPLKQYIIQPSMNVLARARGHRQRSFAATERAWTLQLYDERNGNVFPEPIFVYDFVPAGYARSHLLFHRWQPDHGEELHALSVADPEVARALGGETAIASKVAQVRDLLKATARADGQTADEWNGQQFALREIHVRREEAQEHPGASLFFSPAEHASYLAISELWKEVYATAGPSLLGTPDQMARVRPLLSNTFGMNATVVLPGEQLVITRRSVRNSGPYGGYWHTSVNEGMSPRDLSGGRPDPYRALQRGIQEELGIDVPTSSIVFHTIILAPRSYQWGLLGHVSVGESVDLKRLTQLRARGEVKDRMETDAITTVDFEKATALQDRLSEGLWVPWGALSVVQSYRHVYDKDAADLFAIICRSSNRR